MASLKVTPDELRILDQARQRFQQLSNSIGSLRADIINSNPLPNTASLAATENIIYKDLNSIRELLDQNSDLFQRLAIHPSTNFPGRTQEHVLIQLIRKKLEPDVEEIVSAGLARGATVLSSGGPANGSSNGNGDSNGNANGNGNGTSNGAPPFVPSQNTIAMGRAGAISVADVRELREMWGDIQAWIAKRIMTYVSEEANEIYTPEELAMGGENVRTGLRKPLDYDSEDEEEDEEGTPIPKKPVGPEIPFVDPERVLSFGVKLDMEMAPNFDFESKRIKIKQAPGQRR